MTPSRNPGPSGTGRVHSRRLRVPAAGADACGRMLLLRMLVLRMLVLRMMNPLLITLAMLLTVVLSCPVQASDAPARHTPVQHTSAQHAPTQRTPAQHAAANDSAAATQLSFATFEHAEALVIPMTRVLEDAYRPLGISIRVTRLPLTRSLVEANAGQYDADLGRIAYNASEAPNLRLVPTAIGTLDYRAYMLRDRADTRYASWSALKTSGLRIGSRLGARTPDHHLGAAISVRTPTHDALLKMLLSARIDVLIGTAATTRATLAQWQARDAQAVAQVVELQPSLGLVTMHHLLHQRHSALIAPLDTELKKMQALGRIEQIWRESAEQELETR